jgi:energy-coupling factor transporter ATP-binding protein EcfA2
MIGTVALLETLMCKASQPVLITGSLGCGKTTLANMFVAAVDPSVYTYAKITCKSTTSISKFRASVRSALDRQASLGSIIIFIDDLSVANPTLGRIVQQMLETRTTDDPTVAQIRITIAQAALMAAARMPMPSNHALGTKVQRHFLSLLLEPTSSTSIEAITRAKLTHRCSSLSLEEESSSAIQMWPSMTSRMFTLMTSMFLPTISLPHCHFNLHDLMRFLRAILTPAIEKLQPSLLMHFWQHEMVREFSDRLGLSADSSVFWMLLRQVCTQHGSAGSVGKSEVKSDLFDPRTSWVLVEEARVPNRWCSRKFAIHVLADPCSILRAQLQQLLKTAAWSKVTTDWSEIALIDRVLKDLTLLLRIWLHPRGHCLMAGPKASGKRTLCRLGALLCGHREFSISRSCDDDLERVKDLLVALLEVEGSISLVLSAELLVVSWVNSLVQFLMTGVAEMPLQFTPEQHDRIREQGKVCMKDLYPSLSSSKQLILECPPLLHASPCRLTMEGL